MPEEKIKKEEIPKLIEELVEKSEKGVEIDKELLKLALEPKQQEDPLIYLMRVSMIRDMLERQKKGEDIDMNKILTFMAIRTAMQPQPQSIDPNLLLALTKTPSGGDSQFSQFMQAYLQQLAQQQQQAMQFNQQLLTILFGQKLQQTEQQVQSIQQSLQDYLKQVDQKIESLKTQVQSSPNPQPDLLEQLEYEIKKKELLEKFAEQFKPKEIVTEGGKINWGKLLDRIIGVGEKVVEKLPARVPEMKPVHQIPLQEIAQPQPVAQPAPQLQQIEQPKAEEEMPTVEQILKEQEQQAQAQQTQ
jgi:hypothetical protein